ncbi:hypothetical protein ACFQJD_18710 [Haloplanus sp. GCM10025708]|uniref:DUF7504 family protein n=1 Tax=Haloferacaceae TaxID=1644056 RepID=UPI00362008BF
MPAYDRVADSGSVLLFDAGSETCGCPRLADPARHTNLLGVTFTRTSSEFLDVHRGAFDTAPARVLVLADDRSVDAAQRRIDAATADGPVDVRSVPSPAALSDVGLVVSETLDDWRTARGRSVLCFDSVTSLLEHSDLDRVFRFLHTLAAEVDAVGGVAAFHVDPTAHDQQTLHVLETLFDDAP